MSDKTKQVEDLLERSIADAKKIKEVAMHGAERALRQKFSNDLKKIYLKKLNEENDIDFDMTDDNLLEEEFSLDEEGPQLDNANEMLPGTDDAEMGDAGLGHLGGDGPSQEMEGGLGGGLDQGATPAPNTMSPMEPQIPATHDDITLPNGTEPDEIELELVFDKDQSLPGDINQFMQNNAAPPTGLDVGQMGGQDMNPQGMDGLGGELPQEPGLGEEDEDPFAMQGEDDLFNDQRPFDMASIQIDDDVLLDYIERSLKNDQLTKKLKEDLEFVTEQVKDLTNRLGKSNKVLESLQKQNVRLVYQNKALIDDSLSEHQKQNIVKALNKAETLSEAKAIYETAKSSTKIKPTSNSINQIFGARATGKPAVLRENRSDVGYLPEAGRWQELAGIRKNNK